MNILYQDSDLIVCIKPPDTVSENTPSKSGLADLLTAQTGGYVGVVHRLDRGVGGVTVYAASPFAAAKLSTAIQAHQVQKQYLAAVHGTMPSPQDSLRDLLFHDRRQNKTFVVSRARAGVKEALLDYQTLQILQTEPHGILSLLRVTLHTGRTHQIRVQFASRGHALLGDGKYGASGDRCPIALFASQLSFPHPRTGKIMNFAALPQGTPWELFDWNTV
ncbi:MAG: RluA family pseudouridine synthase [Clostridia bacterium]|nr:RluA family pseudouridine synthase [Clostridia bacterium]